MGFLREKKIKAKGTDYIYWYWCDRVRDSKKKGGTGKVKSIELKIGKYLNEPILGYYCYMGDINLNEYLESIVAWHQRDVYNRAQIKLDCRLVPGDPPTVTCRSKDIDLRLKETKHLVDGVRHCIECAHENSNIEPRIQSAATYLKAYDRAIAYAADWRNEMDKYLADPDKTWEEEVQERDEYTGDFVWKTQIMGWADDAYTIIDERITTNESNAAMCLGRWREIIDTLVEIAPIEHRKTFEAKVMADVERRAKG